MVQNCLAWAQPFTTPALDLLQQLKESGGSIPEEILQEACIEALAHKVPQKPPYKQALSLRYGKAFDGGKGELRDLTYAEIGAILRPRQPYKEDEIRGWIHRARERVTVVIADA